MYSRFCVVLQGIRDNERRLAERSLLNLPEAMARLAQTTFRLAPILRSTNRRENGDGEDGLQGVQRGRRLAPWVVDNGEKSKHLVNRSGLSHGVILPLSDCVERG